MIFAENVLLLAHSVGCSRLVRFWIPALKGNRVHQGRGGSTQGAVADKSRHNKTKATKDKNSGKTPVRGASGKKAAAMAASTSKSKRSVMPAKKSTKPAAKSPAKGAAKPAAAKTKPIAKPVAKAPVKAPAKVAAKPVAKAAVKPVAKPVAKVEEPKKVLTQRQGFKTNEFVVYPAHGVGQILAIEEQEIAGATLELFVISFIKDKMSLRVPTAKVINVGMRKLSDPALVKRALETLKGRARIKRTMWSRRAQEYEAMINSGDIVAIAEVVRDLYRSESQPEQSYSERQHYEAALDRLSREIAVVQHITETEAVKEDVACLAMSPRRGAAKAEAGADAVADESSDDDGDDDDSVSENEAAYAPLSDQSKTRALAVG